MSEIGHNSNGAELEPRTIDAAGFVLIYRDMRWHPIVGCGNPGTPADQTRRAWSKYEAFQDLIMECRYTAGAVNNGGTIMSIRPGELVGAVSWLAHRWNWTPKATRHFLDLLQDEGMIERGYGNAAHTDSPAASGADRSAPVDDAYKYQFALQTDRGKQKGKHLGKQAHVIKLCNYWLYQRLPQHLGQMIGQTTGQMKGKQNVNLGQQYKEENKLVENKDTPPTPRKRGARRVATFSASEIAESDQAVQAFNAYAQRLGFTRVMKLDDDRRRRLVARLGEIGGLAPFRVALSAIERVPFLLGLTPPKPGQEPFRLDLERLLSTGSQLGNVLCRLIDKAAEPVVGQTGGPGNTDRLAAEIAALDDDAQFDLVVRHANGIWPWDKLAYSPAHPKCAVRAGPLAKAGFTDKTFDERGLRRQP